MLKRSILIDIARGSAMFLVLYAHALEMFFNAKLRPDHAFNQIAFESYRMIFSFHMLAFYFVSGMTATQIMRTPVRKVFRTSLTLLLLAFATHLLFTPVQVFLHWRVQGNSNIAAQILQPIIVGNGFNIIVTWFLVSLAFVQILGWTYVRVRLFGKLAIWSLSVSLYLLSAHIHHQPLSIQSWGVGLAFYLAGHEAVKAGVLRITWSPMTASAALFVSIAILVISYPLNHGCLTDPFATCLPWPNTNRFSVGIASGHIGFVPLFFLTAFAGVAATISLARVLELTRAKRIMAWIGQNTLSLLILNGAFLAFVEPVLAQFFSPGRYGLAAILYSLLLAVVQIGFLPFMKPAIKHIHEACERLAGRILAQTRFLPES